MATQDITAPAAASSKNNSISIESILADLQKTGDPTALVKALTDKETVSKTILDLTEFAAPLVVQSKKATLGERAAASERVKSATSLYGTDLSSSTNKLGPLASALNDAMAAQLSDLTQIEQKTKVRFEQHPLDYIVARATIDDDIKSYDIHRTQVETLTKSISSLNILTQQTAQTQNLIDNTYSAENVARDLQLAAVQASIGVQAAKEKYFGDQFDSIKALNGITDANLDRRIRLRSLEDSVEQRKLTAANTLLLRDERQARLDALKDKAGADAALLADVNKGRTLFNLPPTSLTSLRANKQAFNLFADLGAQANAGVSRIADTPGETAVLLNKLPNGIASSTSADTYEALNTVYETVRRELLASGGKVTPDTMASGVNAKLFGTQDLKGKQVPGTLSRLVGNMEQPSDGIRVNPYRVPDLQTIISANPAIKETLLYKNGIAPLVNTGIRDSSTSTILQAAALDMKATGDFNRITKEIGYFYKSGIELNSALQQHSKFGLPPQDAYIVNGTNYIDSASISAALMKSLYYKPNPILEMLGLQKGGKK